MRAATSKPAAAPALLVLEDGAVFAGTSCGAPGEAFGEICFNTSLEGYLEIVTDPSYAGQIVVLTYPQVGNYGVNADDAQAQQPGPAGARGARPVPHALQLAQPGEPRRLPRTRGRRGHRGRRHPRARAPHPRPWRPAGRCLHRGRETSPRCSRRCARRPSLSGREPGRRRFLRRHLLLRPPRTCPPPAASPWPRRPSPASRWPSTTAA